MSHTARGRRAVATLLLAGSILIAMAPAAPAAAGMHDPADVPARTGSIEEIVQPDGSLKADLGADRALDATGWTVAPRSGGSRTPRFERPQRGKRARTNAVAPAGAAGTTSWASLGSNTVGDGLVNGTVMAMAVYKGELIVAGAYLALFGVPGNPSYIARWNGTRWLGLGAGTGIPNPINADVRALAVWKGDLYVGGSFWDAGGVGDADYLARWNGTTWSAVGDDGAGGPAICCGPGGPGTSVRAFGVTDANLYIGGSFQNAGGVASADYFVRWNGTTYSSVGNVLGDGVFNYPVNAIAFRNSNIYVGGAFTDASSNSFADHLARWTGEKWLPVYAVGGDGPLNCGVNALLWVGSDLYIGGCFTDVRALPCADYLTVFNGGDFTCLGDTGGNGVLDGQVRALHNWNGNVVVGGDFTNAAGVTAADDLATWNPQTSTWSTFGSDGTGDGALRAPGYSLIDWNGRLYVGSPTYNIAGLPTADSVASWGVLPRQQPDAQVRVSGETTFAGGDVYEPQGTWQQRVGYAWVGQSVTYDLRFQNDGGTGARLRIKGAKTNAKVTIVYRRGTTDVTAAVVAGTLVTPKLKPGAVYALTATVTAKAPFGVPQTQLGLRVTATSTTAKKPVDAVRMGFWYPA